MTRRASIGSALALVTPSAQAATHSSADTLAWIVLGAIALFVVGVAIRMVTAARFPRGFRAWARKRRDAFAARNEQWDRADEEFRR